MKTLFTLLLSIFLLSSSLYSQTTKHVLFLGNSYTAVNNLPQIIASLALSMGDSLIHSESTPGGYTLQGHSTNSASLSLIQQGNWDYVVLQEQSQKPSWPLSQVITDVFPYAASLCNSITTANPCAKPLFYMTWGRKNGDSYNCPNWPPVCSYEGMDSLLNLRYRMMADSNEAYVSPVGAAWHYVRNTYNKIELYASDESHPSLEGSYLAACTFYSLIFQKDPSLIINDYGIDASVALKLRTAAKIIAFDSLSKWNVGKYVPVANFNTSQISDTVYFSNTSKYANNYYWDFDDGTNSNVFEPKHPYTNPGIYRVQLEISKCGKTDTISKTIQILPTSMDHTTKVFAKIYPNPIRNKIQIAFEKQESLEEIELYSMDGKLVQSYKNLSGIHIKLNTSNIPKGMYLLRFSINGSAYQYKIVK